MTHNKGFLGFVYHHPLGYPLLLIFRMRWFSRVMGWIFQTPFSKYLIAILSRVYQISLDSYQIPVSGFCSLNAFFTREKKKDFLIFPNLHLGSPADGCIELFRNISLVDYFSVKGYPVNPLKLFGPDVENFIGGDICFCRLRFSDYHRFHFFDDGEILSSISRDGPLYSVDNSILGTGLWISNKSHLMRIRSENFGEILWLEVGATNVGSISNHKKVGERFSRGEEKGYFELGGSAVLMVFQKNRVNWSQDILEKSFKKEEYEVTVGQEIGQKIIDNQTL